MLLCLYLTTASAQLPQHVAFPQGLADIPVAATLPSQHSVFSNTEDMSKCNQVECAKSGGSLGAASVKYCDQDDTITFCICKGSPYSSSR